MYQPTATISVVHSEPPLPNGSRPRARKPTIRTWLALLAALVAVIAFVVPALSGSIDASPSGAAGSVVASASSAGRSTTIVGRSAPTGSSNPGSASSNRSDPRLRAIGFRSQQRLDDHYRKHGREFGNISKREYLAVAQDLRDAPLSKRVIETTQKDGTISRFDRSTGAFTAFDRDLTIRTLFKPNDGENYFWRAAKLDH